MISVTEKQFSEFRCVILPGSCPPTFSHHDEYNRVYRQWRLVWEKVMSHLIAEFDVESFYRSDYIIAIFHGDDVVGQICNRFLDLRTEVATDLEYFQNFKTNALGVLRDRKAERLLTLEWNSINSRYSQRKTGFSFVTLMFYLCIEFARSIRVDCCTAVPRKITKVQNILAEIGFIYTDKGLNQYRCPIDIMLGFIHDIGVSGDATVNAFAKSLWANRIDTLGVTQPPRQKSASLPSFEIASCLSTPQTPSLT